MPRQIVLGHVINEWLTAIVLVAAAAGGLGNVLVLGIAGTAAFFGAGYTILALAPARA